MKRFNQFKLKKELILLFAVGVILLLLLDYAFPAYYSVLPVQAQLQQQQSSPIIGIKITSPVADQQVPVGELTISGISTDNATSDCTVYADWNNLKPFQTAVATGPGGVNDYSTWNFTYTPQYHIITEGTNELTAKLSCISNPTNLTKWNSVNVTGGLTTTSVKPEADVKITSPVAGEQVPVGELTITGTSTDDATTDCQVYVDLNDQKPFQNATATGPGGESDYSNWNYNYTRNYNLITEGTNELTAKLSCFDDSNSGTTNLTKWNSVNVTGGLTTTSVKPEADVKITSPVAGEQVPVGELTITGTSTDDATTDCQVYVDLNDQKPFQNATATGPGGESDYSNWNYNYTRNYNLITEGTNELTAKLSCFDDSNSGTATLTKWNSVNVTGGVTTSVKQSVKPEDVVPPFIFSMPPVE